jgi:hypothetical protein
LGLTDVDANSNEDMNEARATENYENMKAIGDNDREVTIFYLTDKLILNFTCRLPKKSQSLNAWLMFADKPPSSLDGTPRLFLDLR